MCIPNIFEYPQGLKRIPLQLALQRVVSHSTYMVEPNLSPLQEQQALLATEPLFLGFVKQGSHIAQAGLKFTITARLALTSTSLQVLE